VPTVAVHSPLLTDQGTWSHDPFRHLILEVRSVERDAIFTDLFRKLDQVSMAAQPTTGVR
jgi:purine nucleosidase